MIKFGRLLQCTKRFEAFCSRLRHYWRNMDCNNLEPPLEVRGMLKLDRDCFKKTIKVPRLRVRVEQANLIMPLIKKLLLKMERLRPVRIVDGTMCEMLLHPLPVTSWYSLPMTELEKNDVNKSNFFIEDFELSYENWRSDEIFKSVLPIGVEGLTSFSKIGHIVQLNLRNHLLPYKRLIGEVLLDRVPNCRTVVNKAGTIESTFRNTSFELVCGVPEFIALAKENGNAFEFDFSKVYWNPRLSTEHERIVKMLKSGDVLYDVFAGVGPFSVPAAKKRCHVLANDLNPECFYWLYLNANRNRCLDHLRPYNKDARDFILNVLKEDLLKRWQGPKTKPFEVHITMNLPASAVEFLDVFRGLFAKESSKLNFEAFDFKYPQVHVYSFAKGDDTKELVRDLVETNLGVPFTKNLGGIYFVRNVAPKKDMYRISFRLTREILTAPRAEDSNQQAWNFNKDESSLQANFNYGILTIPKVEELDEEEQQINYSDAEADEVSSSLQAKLESEILTAPKVEYSDQQEQPFNYSKAAVDEVASSLKAKLESKILTTLNVEDSDQQEQPINYSEAAAEENPLCWQERLRSKILRACKYFSTLEAKESNQHKRQFNSSDAGADEDSSSKQAKLKRT